MTGPPRRWVRGALRRLASAPLRWSSPSLRAESLSVLWDEMNVRTRIGSGELCLFAPTPLLRARAESILTKEPDTIAWLDTLPRDAVLWDIGANVGVFSLYAAVARGCRVLAFEPAAANFFALTKNIELNGLSDRVTAYCLAVAPASALGVINLDSPALGAAMSQFGKPGEASRYANGRQPVVQGAAGIMFDDLIARFAAPLPTHVKIDVDGLEWPMLRGGERTFAHPGVRSVMVELSLSHDAERNQAIEWLRGRGLMLVSTGAPQGSGGEQAANHLFARRS